MPLPGPRDGESKDEFVSRFMSNEVAKREFPDEKQRVAVAHSTWRRSKGISQPKNAELQEQQSKIFWGDLIAQDSTYCVKCKKQVTIKNSKEEMIRGKKSISGTCPICGTKIFKTINNTKDDGKSPGGGTIYKNHKGTGGIR